MVVTSKEDVLKILAQHQTSMRMYGVTHYGLFGSFLRNESKPESDIDLLVEFEPGKKTFDNFMNLAFYLEAILGRSVDLLTKEALSPYLGPHTLQEVEYVLLDVCTHPV